MEDQISVILHLRLGLLRHPHLSCLLILVLERITLHLICQRLKCRCGPPSACSRGLYVSCMPDTGASQSIVSAAIARDANLIIRPTFTELVMPVTE